MGDSGDGSELGGKDGSSLRGNGGGKLTDGGGGKLRHDKDSDSKLRCGKNGGEGGRGKPGD